MTEPTADLFGVRGVTSLANAITDLLREICRQQHVVLASAYGRNADSAIEALLPGKKIDYDTSGSAASGRGRKLNNEIRLVKVKERPELHSIWVNCFLRWEKKPQKTFKLDTLNWSFFTGNERDNIQRLRAEWHNDPEHPQPHWHFDDEVVTTASSGESEFQSLGRVHLPMSGWKHTVEYPSCWTHPRSDDPGMFIEWSRRTIEVCVDQLCYLLEASGI